MLETSLAVAVPLWIADFQARPEILDRVREIASDMATIIASQGDVRLFGGKKGEAGKVFNALAQALAMGAFQPGGVTFGEQHWDATHAGA